MQITHLTPSGSVTFPWENQMRAMGMTCRFLDGMKSHLFDNVGKMQDLNQLRFLRGRIIQLHQGYQALTPLFLRILFGKKIEQDMRQMILRINWQIQCVEIYNTKNHLLTKYKPFLIHASHLFQSIEAILTLSQWLYRKPQ